MDRHNDWEVVKHGWHTQNLIFELKEKQFMGKLGKKLCFVVCPIRLHVLRIRRGFHGIRTKIKHSQQKLIIESISRLVLIIRPFFLLT
ncbi:hypothetical protein HanRHA438_Chr12g0534791 [Helianthus annuus]|nr:hypothetical protein HanRHA438_Chr12g0534791 [Helianthus annuus]